MIPSNKPITYPARGVSTFAEMKIIRLDAKIADGKMQVKAVLQNFNDEEQEFDPGRHTFAVSIDDVDAASLVTKRIDTILKALNEVAELVYNVQFVQHEIDRATTDGEDTTQLNIDLDKAVDALNADPGIAAPKGGL